MIAAGFLALAVALEANAAAEVAVERLDGAERIDVRLPGKLVDHTVARLSSQQTAVLFLVEPQAAAVEDPPPGDDPCAAGARSAAPRALYRLDVAGSKLVLLRADLPSDAFGLLARDADGDGEDEVFLARAGELLMLGAGEPRRVLGPTDFDLQAAQTRQAELRANPGETLVALDGLGFARFYKPVLEAPWKSLAEVPTSLYTDHKNRHLTLTSPPLEWIGRDSAGQALYASVLDNVGEQRLRVLLVRPEAAAAEERSVEAWGKLPEPERLVEVFFRLLDGQPVIGVLTVPANKLSIFGEKRFRLYRLVRDRSRVGQPALFAVETRINLWQQARLYVRDMDGDGREDVVLGYWKGLAARRLVLDAYLRRADGSFDRAPRTTAIDVEGGERSYIGYESALVHRGSPDLLLIGEGGLHIFPAAAWDKTRKLVEERPALTVPLPFDFSPDSEGDKVEISIGAGAKFRYVPESAYRGEPHIVDLDGDGRGEILVPALHSKAGDVAFSVIRLTAPIE